MTPNTKSANIDEVSSKASVGRRSAARSSQKGGMQKKFGERQRSDFLMQHGYNAPEDIGPGAYDYEKALDAQAPRSPSPDLKNSRPYPEEIDPSVGPSAYSPKKEFVLYENPHWTILGKRSKEGPPEITRGPGDYDPADKSFVPGFKMYPHEGLKDGGGNPGPGPGSFDVTKADKQTFVRSPEALIKGRYDTDRKKDELGSEIGPGTYGDQ